MVESIRFSRRRLGRQVLGVLLATFLLPVIGAQAAAANHGPVGTLLWGYEALGPDSPPGFPTSGRILRFDIGLDTLGPMCLPPLPPPPTDVHEGRAVAQDPSDNTLWYSFLNGGGVTTADGRIHKTTGPPACTSVGSIPFGDGPGGSVQDDIGALDIDPDDGNLWAAGYFPTSVGGTTRQYLYKVDKVSGTILASCYILVTLQAGGNDTLALARLPGVEGSGKYLLTDGVETDPAMPLRVLDVASCVGGAQATTVASYSHTVGLTGIDYEVVGGAPKLVAADLSNIYDLGSLPPGSQGLVPLATMPAGGELEDITLATVLTSSCLLPQHPTVVGTPGDDTIVMSGTTDDVIDGGGGNDVIIAGGGKDIVYGGSGNDVISGGDGNDLICGGPGDDKLYGGAGDDRLEGGNGNDFIYAGAGNDALLGGNNDDRLFGGTGINTNDGGLGNDLCFQGSNTNC